MKLTENKLRSIIRQVILEEYSKSDEINEGFKENLFGLGIAGLMSLGSIGGVSKADAKPLSTQQISQIADSIIEDELGAGTVDIVVERLIEEVLSSVDESHVKEVEDQVIKPWMSAVSLAYSKYKDPVTGMPHYIYKSLEKLLNKKVSDFVASSGQTTRKAGRKRRPGGTRITKQTQSVFSAKDLKAYKQAVRDKDFAEQARIVAKYRK